MTTPSMPTLFEACQTGNMAALRAHLVGDAEILSKPLNEHKDLPIHIAAAFNQTGVLAEIMRVTGSRGAALDVVNEEGDTALILAAGNGSKEAAQMLLANGASVEAKNAKRNSRPLDTAAAAGHKDMVRIFLDAGADMRGVPSYGRPEIQAMFDAEPARRAQVAAERSRAAKHDSDETRGAGAATATTAAPAKIRIPGSGAAAGDDFTPVGAGTATSSSTPGGAPAGGKGFLGGLKGLFKGSSEGTPKSGGGR